MNPPVDTWRLLEYRNSARGYVMALEDEKAMEGLSGNDVARHHPQAEGVWNFGVV